MSYSKLLGRIKEKGLTQKIVAKKIGVSESHFSQKINGRYCFSQSEIERICRLLDIQNEEIGFYFFTREVENF